MQYNCFRRELLVYQEGLSKPNPDWPEVVKRVMDYIHNHLFDEALTIAQVKNICHISSKSFASRFKIYTGFYPKDYILHHRIHIAKRLLMNREMSIVQVGLILGFSSHSAFCKTFKKRAGVQPSAWIKQNRFLDIDSRN